MIDVVYLFKQLEIIEHNAQMAYEVTCLRGQDTTYIDHVREAAGAIRRSLDRTPLPKVTVVERKES